MLNSNLKNALGRRAYIVTGPTSGIGRLTALKLADHGTVILVGRDCKKLDEVQKAIERKRQHAVSIVCDLSDIFSVRRAAAEIIALDLPIAGLLNNAGIMPVRATKNALGWDMTFATNHLGPFALTEALVPHLPDGAKVVFVASGVEDPERKPAVSAGFRGGRYISAEASARGEWKAGGSPNPGFDACATSKQCTLATVMVFTRETPRLHFNAVEPGFNPTTGLGRDASAAVRFLVACFAPLVVPLLIPFMPFLSTPNRAARMIAKVLLDTSDGTGLYYDQSGNPMLGSALVRDPKFQDRVVAETRAFLAAVPA
ncbi:NAD(P)-dependent dehydrogenase (short-subunit alcohol dehydrogenase family) [Rhizobium sp. BK512]|uniref:SDR family NAD(P)-dependent oxidoreductase n=1 Tax=Rhizobium sp. BK512 TaxID=2587010 RepID=UPI0017D4D8C8|nr:SDR family NAD(P)-dependent oxidoreductase [Rhizobium sp. BK512]MBB3564369.1 NAD(P)-dependent dehydrogenase (short-subunit alcohol dehydrogenase family) [Rhizobium sp. BK512]